MTLTIVHLNLATPIVRLYLLSFDEDKDRKLDFNEFCKLMKYQAYALFFETYLFVLPMYSEMLDVLEDALDELTDCEYTIFSMHFTLGMMCPIEFVRSTKTGRNLKEKTSD